MSAAEADALKGSHLSHSAANATAQRNALPPPPAAKHDGVTGTSVTATPLQLDTSATCSSTCSCSCTHCTQYKTKTRDQGAAV